MKHFLKAYGHFAERDFLLMAGPSTAGLRWKHVSYTWVEMGDGRWKKKHMGSMGHCLPDSVIFSRPLRSRSQRTPFGYTGLRWKREAFSYTGLRWKREDGRWKMEATAPKPTHFSQFSLIVDQLIGIPVHLIVTTKGGGFLIHSVKHCENLFVWG